jgi:hypothetical protein
VRNSPGGSGSCLEFRLARSGARSSGYEPQAIGGRATEKTEASANKIGRRGRAVALGLRSFYRVVAAALKRVIRQPEQWSYLATEVAGQTCGITNISNIVRKTGGRRTGQREVAECDRVTAKPVSWLGRRTSPAGVCVITCSKGNRTGALCSPQRT